MHDETALSSQDNQAARSSISRYVPAKILIVDDEPVITSTLAIIFANAGYDARTTSSAEEALELIADWSPDLAFLDVILPKMTGIELAILLRVKHPNCRIALFSGQAATRDLLSGAKALGYTFDVIAKPVHPETLLTLAAQLSRAI
jgi:DNA-binding response OmpR family regulator